MHSTRKNNGRTVFNTILQHQLSTLLRGFPPWRDVTPRRLATELRKLLVGLIEYRFLLLDRHPRRVLMAISVEAAESKYQSVTMLKSRAINKNCHTSRALHL